MTKSPKHDKKSSKRGILGRKSYNFLTKDPAIDIVRTAIEDSGLSLTEIHNKNGPTVSTMTGWLKRDTKRPQFFTMRTALMACGYDFVAVSPEGKIIKIKNPKK